MYILIYIYVYVILVLTKRNSHLKNLDLQFFSNKISTDFSHSITQAKSSGSNPHF